MSNIKMFFSVILGVMANIILGLPVFVIGVIIRRKDIGSYLYNVAIALDELGGTLIYNKKDSTVSYRTGYYAVRNNIFAIIFSHFIDLLFGKNHCRDEYLKKENI